MAMGRSETAIITLEEAKGRFEEWRSNRRGKSRIPAELWSAAVEVARKEGINRTARELHVAWDDLKRRSIALTPSTTGWRRDIQHAATPDSGVLLERPLFAALKGKSDRAVTLTSPPTRPSSP